MESSLETSELKSRVEAGQKIEPTAIKTVLREEFSSPFLHGLACKRILTENGNSLGWGACGSIEKF
jgi:hypothetical protein